MSTKVENIDSKNNTYEDKELRKKSKFKKKMRKNITGYMFILPLLIGVVVLNFIPFVLNLFYSLTDLGSFGQWDFVGIDNFKRLLDDPLFFKAVGNTFLYVIVTVPIMVIISICIANLLNKNIRGKGIYRTLYFLPVVTMASASTLVFQWMFNAEYGLVNQVLKLIGLEGQMWFSNPDLARVVIMIFIIWGGLGYKIMILLGGLQSIPESYYEAASIDGASPFKQFIHITIPLLTPSIFFIVIWSLIGSFQLFDVVFMLIPQGSPSYESTITMTRYFYDLGFTLGDKGYASGVAVILFLIIMTITLIQFKLQKRWVHYSDE